MLHYDEIYIKVSCTVAKILRTGFLILGVVGVGGGGIVSVINAVITCKNKLPLQGTYGGGFMSRYCIYVPEISTNHFNHIKPAVSLGVH